MANPQQENGHTRIANELLEAILIYPFVAGEYKVVLAVARNTYGWSRKKAKLSYGEISRKTGLNRRHVYRTCLKLLTDGVLFIQKNKSATCPNIIGLNKNFEMWSLWKTCGKITPTRDFPGDTLGTSQGTPRDTGVPSTRDFPGDTYYIKQLKQYNKTNLKQGKIIFKADLEILFKKYSKDRYLVKQHLIKVGFTEIEIDNACLRHGFANVVGGNIIYV